MNLSRRTTAGIVCSLLMVAYFYVVAKPASSAEAPTVTIREALVSPSGRARVIVSVAGVGEAVLKKEAFALSESGKGVSSLTVTPLLQSRVRPVTVAMVFDISGSTAGRPLADAKAAGKRFVSLLPAGVRVMVVAFGPKASIRQGLTADRSALNRAIDGLTASGGTAMYDGIVLAASRLGGVAAQHNILLFSDGKDTASVRTLSQAVAAAKKVSAPVTSVGLVTSDSDAAALSTIADATGGRSLRVSQSGQLGSAFGQVAKDIASQYVLEYKSGAVGPKEIELAVTLRIGALTASDSIVMLNPRTALPPPPPAITAPEADAPPPIKAFTGRVGLYVGIAAVFFALILFLVILLPRPGERGGDRLLRNLRVGKTREGKTRNQEHHGLSGTAIGRTAAQFVERVPKRANFDARLQMQLDRAGWPLRASEFVVLQIAGVMAGALVGFGLLERWWLGIVLAIAGAGVFRVILSRKIERRKSVFLSQLPETLQLLAGSLQAGYAFMQGLDTLVQETSPPTSSEFGRVLTETRLGNPVEDSMSAMADRLDSDDFRWVVLAINIQRQVGGNLAVLLQTVASTLREREQVRRQIKVLSAEGRLSASILTVLPFLLAGYISVVNPAYIGALITETLGRVMIVGALMLMGIGILWMRKIVNIDV